jgi:hypothetical protein
VSPPDDGVGTPGNEAVPDTAAQGEFSVTACWAGDCGDVDPDAPGRVVAAIGSRAGFTIVDVLTPGIVAVFEVAVPPGGLVDVGLPDDELGAAVTEKAS